MSRLVGLQGTAPIARLVGIQGSAQATPRLVGLIGEAKPSPRLVGLEGSGGGPRWVYRAPGGALGYYRPTIYRGGVLVPCMAP